MQSVSSNAVVSSAFVYRAGLLAVGKYKVYTVSEYYNSQSGLLAGGRDADTAAGSGRDIERLEMGGKKKIPEKESCRRGCQSV